MPVDNIDELLRKKKLDELNAQIGQGAQVEDQGVQNLTPRDSEEDTEPVDSPAEESREPASSPMDSKSARMIADAVAGATPTLLSFLGGASPSVVNMQADKMNAYAKARGIQDIPTKQNTTVLDDGTGKPQIAMMADSLGKQPWQKPSKVGANSAAGSYQFSQIYDPVTKQYTSVKYNTRDGQVLNLDNTPYTGAVNSIVRPGKEAILNSPTLGGGKNIDRFNQYQAPNQAVKRVVTAPGRGDTAGGITKEEYDAMAKGAQKGREEATPIKLQLAQIDSVTNDPNTLKNPVVFSTNFGSLLRATVGEKRLSDDEQSRYEGGRYKTFFQKAYNIMDGNFKGEIPQDVINDFIALKESTRMKLESQLGAINTAYTNPGVVQNKQTRDAQVRMSGQDPKKVTNSAKAELIAFEKQAAQAYGKGTDKYNKAMQFKKDKLGL